MGQRSQTGYLFILNVLFRPALMVVGFLLGSVMVSILTDYIMNLFPIIIANASMDSYTGLIKIAAYFSAFIIILQSIVNVSFQMIRFVPDQVLGWIGGNSVNQIGAQTADEVGGVAKNAFAARGTMMGSMDGKGTSQAVKANQQRNSDRENARQSGAASEAREDARTDRMVAAMPGGGGGGPKDQALPKLDKERD